MKSTTVPIRVLDDRVVIQPNEAETEVRGILLPDKAKAKPQRGRVIAVGPGKSRDSDGQRSEMQLAVGDEVLFARYAGHDVEVNHVSYKIMKEDDVLAKVDGE